MTESKTGDDTKSDEKKKWEESRDKANSTNLETASPALNDDALTKTKDSKTPDDLSKLDEKDLPKSRPKKSQDRG